MDKIELQIHIGRLIYDKRVSMGLTQTDLAMRVKLKQATVSKIENGTEMPRIDNLLKFADAFAWDISKFFDMKVHNNDSRFTIVTNNFFRLNEEQKEHAIRELNQVLVKTSLLSL